MKTAIAAVAAGIGLTVAAAATLGGRTAADPPAPLPPPARVEGVYPSGSPLPANLLRLYVVFSAPMRQGEVETRLRLLDASGRPVRGAFLRVDEELWDPGGRRLTVLFDPGRVKRGLKTNRQSGAPLVEGQRYSLVVDREWRDAHGRPLAAGLTHSFDVVAADRDVPDVDRWQVEAPVAGSLGKLVLHFPEPLDRALLSSALAVQDGTGATMEGAIEVDRHEQRWSFTPQRPWSPGEHAVRVSPDLEDVAGNNLLRPFDADLAGEPGPRRDSNSAARTRRFIVSGT